MRKTRQKLKLKRMFKKMEIFKLKSQDRIKDSFSKMKTILKSTKKKSKLKTSSENLIFQKQKVIKIK